MSLRDAVAELAAVWPRLPEFVGADWPDLAPRLQRGVEEFTAAATDNQRAVTAGRLLLLLRPYEGLKRRLDAALRAGSARGPDRQDPTPTWLEITDAVATAVREQRWINATFAGVDPTAELRPGQPYVLILDIAAMPDPAAVNSARSEFEFAVGEEMMELSVEVTSPDADVTIEPLTSGLLVPRRGPSPKPARFLVTPGRAVMLTLHVLFLRNRNFVQVMTIETAVADPATTRARVQGRRIAAAARQRPRDLSIVVLEQAGQHRVLLTSSHTVQATLSSTVGELNDIVTQTHRALLDVVNTRCDGVGLIYQQQLDIPEDVHHKALRRLAVAGYRLYQRLFFGPAADAQLRNVGIALRSYVGGQPLRIQVVADRLLIPWHLMYVADALDRDAIDPECFLGLRHIIEYIPLNACGDAAPVDLDVDTAEGVDVMLAINDDIDRGGKRRLVADQVDYWQAGSPERVRVSVRRTRDDVLDALAHVSRADQLLYFYCHAAAHGLDDDDGPSGTRFVFTAGTTITMDDLYVDAPIHRALRGGPLVVLNACESTRMSPQFYDGFLPYFIARRARGVIGTEVDTPALVAAEWARRFFDRLLAGETIGEAVLAVRRELLNDHRNPLGLLYALYCDGDTAFRPAVR